MFWGRRSPPSSPVSRFRSSKSFARATLFQSAVSRDGDECCCGEMMLFSQRVKPAVTYVM
jgi:hypothetical protein